ncbi:MAG: hypothetical protein QGI65_07305 [SAR324 cluster bacterium]|jgi:hypothetical protein|nr:hypothetical protein [SAR324 cluster bacterium]MDP6522446.1 hypothetical protein [SAR324 cluster bacterium]|tara:strand:+ start:484 stop:1005 length:522 start_codon:yes stop_codon:yes gene_type:complete
MSNVSPYTRVIAECLHSLSDDKPDDCVCDTKQVMQLLINMLQGRMLEHIKERVSSYYKIEQDALNEEFSVCLIEVFAEIFGLFRNKFEEMPWLVNEIAKRIVEAETRNGSKTERSINQLYLSIFCKYFEYKNIEKIISTLQTDPRIQRTIISAIPATALPNSAQFPSLSRSSV